jgi:hypothetical protein
MGCVNPQRGLDAGESRVDFLLMRVLTPKQPGERLRNGL